MLTIFLTLFWLVFYIYFQSFSVYGGDAGDLISAAYTAGVPHPPGFPLYTFIGYLLTKLPLGTVAWRMGLLSSIPAAFTLVFIFLTLKRIYGNTIISLIAVLFLGFSYPFWLFGTTVEVLALNSFFISLLVFFLVEWVYLRKTRYLLLSFLVLGLALAHHQIIVFLLPAILYLIYSFRKKLPKNRVFLTCLAALLVLLGFSPFLYAYFSARSNPPILWVNSTDLVSMWKLFSREYYGSFFSGSEYAKTLSSRFLQLGAYFTFLYNDFTLAGISLLVIGIFRQLKDILKDKKREKLKLFFLLCFLSSGVIFYFYAAYYLMTEVRLGIFEKFLTFSYIFIPYYLVSGMLFCKDLILRLFSRIVPKISPFISNLSINLFLFFLPFLVFYITFPKTSILKNDFTAEALGKDILQTPEKGSILLITKDIELFNTQYVYYIFKERQDIKLIYVGKVLNSDFNAQLKKFYPDLSFPGKKEKKYLESFVKSNYHKFPIYSNVLLTLDMKDYFWVRYGLLFRLYNKKDVPKEDKIMKRNLELVDKYNDPMSGSLSQYPNLFVSGVVTSYREFHADLSKFLAKTGNYNGATTHIKEAQRLEGNNPNNYFREGEIHFLYKKCDLAKKSTERALSLRSSYYKGSISDYNFLLGMIYEECYKDKDKAKQYFDISKRELEKERARQ